MGRHQQRFRKGKAAPEPTVEDLDRFAGSSDEEVESESSESELEAKQEQPQQQEPFGKPEAVSRELSDAHEEEDEDDADSQSDDQSPELDTSSDEEEIGVSGMANAMSKILGTTVKTGAASVVLSKTTTPLQRMAKEEKEKAKEQREKRRANRERNLAALHVPLSVATTRQTADGSSSNLVKELEMERMHRRVATRGVVALFNAIAQHQRKAESESTSPNQPKAKTDVKKLTKHGFLDMIKTAAAKSVAESESHAKATATEKETESRNETESRTPQWNALKDDYMLNSKLKDWDRESSDEGSADQQLVDDDWSDHGDEETKQGAPFAKRRRINVR